MLLIDVLNVAIVNDEDLWYQFTQFLLSLFEQYELRLEYEKGTYLYLHQNNLGSQIMYLSKYLHVSLRKVETVCRAMSWWAEMSWGHVYYICWYFKLF